MGSEFCNTDVLQQGYFNFGFEQFEPVGIQIGRSRRSGKLQLSNEFTSYWFESRLLVLELFVCEYALTLAFSNFFD
jgi:hypothetical protein